MTLTQTVDIPDTRLLSIKVPQEMPVGKARLVFFPVNDPPQPVTPDVKDNGKIRMTRKEWDELLEDETLRSLTGILHTDMTLDEIRTERLAKHL